MYDSFTTFQLQGTFYIGSSVITSEIYILMSLLFKGWVPVRDANPQPVSQKSSEETTVPQHFSLLLRLKSLKTKTKSLDFPLHLWQSKQFIILYLFIYLFFLLRYSSVIFLQEYFGSVFSCFRNLERRCILPSEQPTLLCGDDCLGWYATWACG